MLNTVRAIAPLVAEHASESAEQGGLAMDVIDIIRATGAFRMFVPTDLNGSGLPLTDSLAVLEQLSHADSAAGWCAMSSSAMSMMASSLPDPHATDLFEDPWGLHAGSFSPSGTATPLDGGLLVNGTWSFGSLARDADWIGGNCVVVDEAGAPAALGSGERSVLVFAPADDVHFIDNWHVSGLSGTASGDFVMSNVFIPGGRWAQIGNIAPIRDNEYSRFPFFGVIAASIAACCVGIAQRAIDELVAWTADPESPDVARTTAGLPSVQAALGESETKLSAARAFLMQAADATWRQAAAGERPTIAGRRQLRMSATHACHAAAEVCTQMFIAGGGQAIYKTNPLQRLFNDAHAAIQHGYVTKHTFETVGKMLLGQEPDTNSF